MLKRHLLITVAMFCIYIGFFSQVQAANVLVNGDFSNGTNNWSSYFAGGVYQFYEQNGEGVVSRVKSATSSNSQVYQVGFPLKPNTHYTLSFDARTNALYNITVPFYLHKHTANYASLWPEDPVFTVIPNVNTHYTYTFTTKTNFTEPNTNTRLRIGVKQSSLPNGYSLYFDNIVLEEGTTPTPTPTPTPSPTSTPTPTPTPSPTPTPIVVNPPTCTISVSATNFYSDTGVDVSSTVSSAANNLKIKWAASSGLVTPTSPTSPVDANGYISSSSTSVAANWKDSYVHSNGVTLTLYVKNDGGQNTCTKLIYPSPAESTLEIVVKKADILNKPTSADYCKSLADYPVVSSDASYTLTKNPGATTYLSDTARFDWSYEKQIEEYPGPSATGEYGIALDISQNYPGYEVKCIRHNERDTEGVNLTNTITENTPFYVFGTTREHTDLFRIVISPKPIYPWFKAYGGQIYSYGSVENDIPESLGTFFDSLSNIKSGALSTLGQLLAPKPANYLVEYGNQTGYLQRLKAIIDENKERLEKISSVSALNSNNSTHFYYWDGALPLVINENVLRVGHKKTSVLFVDGDVEITKDVTELNVFLISTGKITIKERPLTKTVVTNGGCETEIKTENWEEEIYQTYNFNTNKWNMGQATKTKIFTKPADANYVVIKALWEWSGKAGDNTQKGEAHWTRTDLGDVHCKDFGDSSLEGRQFLCGTKEKKFSSNNLTVNFELDAPQDCVPTGSQACNGSHKAIATISWCSSSKTQETAADPLVIYGALISEGNNGKGLVFESVADNYQTLDSELEQIIYQPEVYFSNDPNSYNFMEYPTYFVKLD